MKVLVGFPLFTPRVPSWAPQSASEGILVQYPDLEVNQ